MTQKTNQKVLIVELIEDDAALRGILARKCAEAGIVVSEAENGEVGLQKAFLEHPDLIVLDLLMPKKDGMQFLTELRENPWGKDAEVIILSNVSEVEKVAEALEHKTFSYIVKTDTDLDKIVKTIQDHITVSPKQA